MFEQSSYKPEPVAEPATTLPEDALFQNYELRTWDVSPRLYKILGASAAANILALLVVAQTSLLTMKGCDSPLVGSVCQALDTVYIGSLLFGTTREYVDAQYEKTELANADITYIDATGLEPPFTYPPDYFKTANPESQQSPDPTQSLTTGFQNFPETALPTATPNNGDNMFNTKPVYPKRRNKVFDGPLPTGVNDNMVADANTNGNPRKPGKGKNIPENNSNSSVAGNGNNPTIQADKKDDAAPDQNGVYINKAPTRDFATEALQKLENKQVVLDAPFKVTIKGTLGFAKDGKTVIIKNPQPVIAPGENAGDPAMMKFAQEAIIAFSDAGWFGYLDKLDSKNVVIHFEQNDTAVIARLTADQPDENRARSAASGLNVTLYGAALASEGDTRTFLEAAKTGNDGKTFFVNMELPKQVFTEMVQRKLAEQKAAPKQSTQPSSNTSGRSADNTARN